MKIATRLRVFVAKFILYFGNPWLGRSMAVRGEGGVICWKGAASRRRRRRWVSSFAHCQSHLFGGRRWVRRAVRVGGLALGPLWTTARNPHLGNSAEAVCSFSPGCAHQHTRTEPPFAPGWSRGVNNTWSPPSSFCQRSDTRRRSHGTDDGAESGGMRGNTAMAMRLCCCRDVRPSSLPL